MISFIKKLLLILFLLFPLTINSQTLGSTTGMAMLGSMQEMAGGPFPYYYNSNPFPLEMMARHIQTVQEMEPKMEAAPSYQPIYLQDKMNREDDSDIKLNHGLKDLDE